MNHRELKSPGQRLYEKQLEESGGTIPWSLLDVCTRENLERDANSDKESCFRNLMTSAQALLKANDICLCEPGGRVVLCPWCRLAVSCDACTQATARAAEHDKAMEQVGVSAMELMDEDYVRLALSFPSIRNCPGLTEALKSAASPYRRTIAMLGCLHSWLWKGTKGKLEETERQACLFILSLWRRRDIWPEFDLYRALEVWDDQHRAAFQSWVTNFQRP